MTYTESTKASIYKWRSENAEAYRELQRRLSKAYYEKNKAIINAKKRQKRAEQKELTLVMV
jgi:hypothetical protein